MSAMKEFFFTQVEKLGLDSGNLSIDDMTTALYNHAQEVCTNGALDDDEVQLSLLFLPTISEKETLGKKGQIFTDKSGTKFLIVA